MMGSSSMAFPHNFFSAYVENFRSLSEFSIDLMIAFSMDVNLRLVRFLQPVKVNHEFVYSCNSWLISSPA